MDIARPEMAKQKKRKRFVSKVSFTLALLSLISFFFFYDPGPLSVDGRLISTAKVKRGEMKVSVSGVGTLVPSDVRWIVAETAGRIEKIHVLPGSHVEPETRIMTLSNPEIVQTKQNMELQLASEKADFKSFKARLENSVLLMESEQADLKGRHNLAILEARINRRLFDEGLESELSMRRSDVNKTQLESRLLLEKKRLERTRRSVASEIHAESSRIKQTEARIASLNQQIESFDVKAGFEGILQKQTVEEGQQVSVGQNLSQVTNPKSLKAVIKISEHLAQDIQLGQLAQINTRSAIVSGQVQRIDPNVEGGTVAVDVQFTDPLPSGLRPDLTVEGMIEVFKLSDVTYAARPSYAQSYSGKKIFKVSADGLTAKQIDIRFGRVSVDLAEIESGLRPDDEIIISDTSEWDEHPVIQIN